MTTASQITVAAAPPPTMASTTRPASTGVDTARTAETTVSSRKTASSRQYGRAKDSTRRTVPGRTPLGASARCMALRINIQPSISPLLPQLSWPTRPSGPTLLQRAAVSTASQRADHAATSS